jgi:aminoglycoside N3'-acetyltransferase
MSAMPQADEMLSTENSKMSLQCGAAKLHTDLQQLGLARGDSVFVHSSFKSLGPVKGGALTVIRSLESVVGSSGHILMPSFNLVERERRAETWHVEKTPATTGWLTEFFRTLQGTVRSNHYSHAVAARGERAQEWVANDDPQSGMVSPWDLEPWGKTFGMNSPIVRCYRENVKVLMLGTTYHSLTFLHLLEVMDWNRRLAVNPASEFRWIDRQLAGGFWETRGKVRFGKVGLADCRLFLVRDMIDDLLGCIEEGAPIFKK